MADYFLIPALEASLYVLAACGLYFLVRIMKFPDISCDNVFSFGGFVGLAVATRSHLGGVAAALLGGGLLGSITSALHSLNRVPKLMAGVVTYSALFSVNLWFFGRPNIPVPEHLSVDIGTVVFVDLVVLTVVWIGLGTRVGKALIAAGSNPGVLREFGAPYRTLLAIGLGLGNALIALSGFLAAFYFGFVDIGLGVGVLINSIATLMVTEELARRLSRIPWVVLCVAACYMYNLLSYSILASLMGSAASQGQYKLVGALVIVGLFAIDRKRRFSRDPLFG